MQFEIQSLVIILWNLTVAICSFYLDTPDCCIPGLCCRGPVHCSPLRHWWEVDLYTFFFVFEPLLHKSLNTHRTASSLNNHHLLPKKKTKDYNESPFPLKGTPTGIHDSSVHKNNNQSKLINNPEGASYCGRCPSYDHRIVFKITKNDLISNVHLKWSFYYVARLWQGGRLVVFKGGSVENDTASKNIKCSK